MEILITVLIVLLVLGAIVTVVGHSLWLALAWIFRQLTGETPPPRPSPSVALVNCPNCNFQLSPNAVFCGRCGLPMPFELVGNLLRDLAATERQLERFHASGKLDAELYAKLKAQIQEERQRLNSRGRAAPSTVPHPVEQPAESATQQPVSFATSVEQATPNEPPSPVVTASFVATDEEIVIEPTPSFLPPQPEASTSARAIGPDHREFVHERPPRRSFAEMLNSFMEESNIRWGEIVGGLLIIGCSTALVVSLWSQISQIPVLKFLIFTTVTATLFGVGLYTEHRWKLPTTSRGILTIATLLVPLNFLAIAAVSGGNEYPGVLIIGSELIAPAVFLCLVYFAGRVLTPSWPHLLGAGVLGSSIGQLLVRHFASPEISSALLVILGAFPVACYVGSTVWMLRKVLADREIDENETIAVFISLGAMTFAAVLPFGLLLYKSGSVGMTMMYLAPLVSLGGFPLLATGTLLWQRITNKELVASRTAGTSMAILGTLIVVLGMILAWPNPAGIVPAALFNFAVFTTLAILLNIPRAHLLASVCFGLAYLVVFQVIAGHVAWQNLRVTSLLQASLSVSSAQALAILFVLFLGASEWLARKRTNPESNSYLIAACAIAVISLALIWLYGTWVTTSAHELWPIFAIYALGAFWIARREQQVVFSWLGSFFLLVAFAQSFAASLSVSFPWQAAMLAHATVCAAGAILAWYHERNLKGILTQPLYLSALLTSFIAIVFLFEAREWQTTAEESQRVFWLAGIWLALLWVVRHRALFAAFQIALTCAVVLTIKGVLQQYEWYAYLPHAFLHPWGLQIQGTALVLLSLGWIAVRFAFKSEKFKIDKLKFVGHLVDSRWAVDRLVVWGLLGAFVLLTIYGALPGVTRELTAEGVDNPTWNIAGFPHQEAFGIGSWILFGLLLVVLIANAWERRRAVYILGGVVALSLVCPLLAGRFETEIATASAWRWLAALFLLIASLPLLYRDQVFAWLKSFGWPQTDMSDAELARRIRVLLLISTLGTLLILTAYPALRAIYYMPVHGPAAGVFSLLNDRFSYGAPLVIVAFVLIGYAVRERLPAYAFAAGLLFNVTVTMTYLLSVVAVNGSMNRVVFAQAIQLNAISSAIYALIWLGTRSRWINGLDEASATTAKRLLKLQVGIAVLINALLIAPVAVRLIMRPGWAGIGTIESGSLSGWAAFLLTVVAATWFAKAYRERFKAEAVTFFLTGLTSLAAFTAARWEAGNWTGFHTLMAGMAASAWLMCLARSAPSRLEVATASASFFRLDRTWFEEDWEWSTSLCATALGALTVLLALRAPFDDPTGTTWSVATLVAMGALAAALNWQTLKHLYIYAGGLILVIAISIWSQTTPRLQSLPFIKILEVNIGLLCLASIGWLLLELRARRIRTRSGRAQSLSFHNLASRSSLVMIGLLVLRGLRLDLNGSSSLFTADLISWFALASLIALFIACLWDGQARYVVGGLYLCGLLIVGLALDRLNLPPLRLTWSGMMALAVYTIVASLVWHSRQRVIELADRLKIPRHMDPSVPELKWLNVFNVILATFVLFMAYQIVLTFAGSGYRLTAALAVAGLALTFALMAEGVWRIKWQRTAIAALVVGVVFFGWAFLVPGVTGTWLNRAVILMVEMFAVVGLYVLVLNKGLEREPDWMKATRDCIPWIAGAGVVALIFALSTEVFYQINFGAVLIHPASLVAVGVTLVAGIVICILFALSPKYDPLSLSEQGRMNYVYAAEAMLALLFMHIRLTMPWLFTGFFERYWPLVVIAIAYLGVAISEALRRREVLGVGATDNCLSGAADTRARHSLQPQPGFRKQRSGAGSRASRKRRPLQTVELNNQPPIE